ncbi:glutaredoxin-like protein [Pseudonocardia sp. TMWB2A]|jgi:mycoredoxin|nr:mycoredoxin [Pseudonocardia sp. SID8383]ALE80591.1 glutaredoxin [Pseudonocardia sp. AL041005-10]MBO4241005.1 mycoredoxin [Pseudonocardia alni]MCM3848361.1 mycoredoxin [Pseudonocardia sp. DR1-2]MCO7192158.1 mycoredoxin [Pseudonocardia sp. McavD-2-B]NWJ71138.1 mycoredoxin [Pseudonocardia pini]
MADLTMYTTSWCGFCRRLKLQLDQAGIGYREIDIEREPDAVAFVEKANGGNRTVPTVVFPDESVATNPSFSEVKTRLGV